MAKKLETAMLVASLKKAARKTKKPIWFDLASRLESPRRNKITVNMGKISIAASKNKGKTLVVPGKILSEGELAEEAIIVAVSASQAAKAKIKAKGEFISLKEFAAKAEKVKVGDLVIVK